MIFLETSQIRNTPLKNKIVMPPMCMYEAINGKVNSFHVQHYGSRAIGGVGLIITEATAVSPEGRISDRDLGLWADDLIDGQKRIVDVVHSFASKIAIQLNHAGRKSESIASPHIAPSSISYSDDYAMPMEMSLDEIKQTQTAFIKAAKRAYKQVLMALNFTQLTAIYYMNFYHLYLTKEKILMAEVSENRARFLRELIIEMRAALKAETFLIVRISASDYDPEGLTPTDLIEILKPVKQHIDAVHVSSGGNKSVRIEVKPMYQVDFADEIKKGLNIPTIAVGLITTTTEIESILSEHKADFVALGRELLRNPYFCKYTTWQTKKMDDLPIPYLRAYK